MLSVNMAAKETPLSVMNEHQHILVLPLLANKHIECSSEHRRDLIYEFKTKL